MRIKPDIDIKADSTEKLLHMIRSFDPFQFEKEFVNIYTLNQEYNGNGEWII